MKHDSYLSREICTLNAVSLLFERNAQKADKQAFSYHVKIGL
jgi:hypothetical protein